MRRAGKCCGKGRRSQVLIRKTLDPQAPESVTHVDAPIQTRDSLPGEVPVIDHLCLHAREESAAFFGGDPLLPLTQGS
jgi:hypothetical protein